MRFLRREIKADTGGRGKFRGGCALETEIEMLADCESTILGSRFKGALRKDRTEANTAARARSAGSPLTDSVTEFPPKITGVHFKKGDRLVMRPCGGGGLGDPVDARACRIEEDIAARLSDARGGARDYGYKQAAE